MKWVTWQNVGVDRIACAWLIRKLVDPVAEFLFVPEGSSKLPQGAEPFDIPGTKLSHHGGHCSFYAMLREYKLDDPILKRITLIIDEADTVQEVSLESAAPGLDLIVEVCALPAPTTRAHSNAGLLSTMRSTQRSRTNRNNANQRGARDEMDHTRAS